MSGTNSEIQALQELVQKNLEVVQKILGIERINNFDEDELVEQEIVGERDSKIPLKKLTASELNEQKQYLVEQKHYLVEQKRYNTAKYTDNQDRFTESRQKFLNRPKTIRPSSKNLKLV